MDMLSQAGLLGHSLRTQTADVPVDEITLTNSLIVRTSDKSNYRGGRGGNQS